MTGESSPTIGTSSSAPQNWIRSYYPAFDGLRAVAVLMVFVHHYQTIVGSRFQFHELWTGVDLFFVLSGFLITGILYDSRNSKHYFHNFYIRRALRILPLVYAFFLAILLLTPVLHLRYSAYIWTNLVYVANLFVPGAELHLHGNPSWIVVPHIHGGIIDAGHLWSLCVEEQFYLLWPFAVWLIPARQRLLHLCSALIVLTVALRIYLFFHCSAALLATDYLYVTTYTRCDSLLVGAWLSLWLRGTKLSRPALRRTAANLFGWNAGLLALTLIACAEFGWASEQALFQTIGYTMVALAAAGVILLCLDETSWLHHGLRTRWLAGIGRISYGFYFFHKLPIKKFHAIADQFLRPHSLSLLIIPLAFGYSYAAAWLSFRYLESPFLRLKKVLAPAHRSVPSGTEAAPPPAAETI